MATPSTLLNTTWLFTCPSSGNITWSFGPNGGAFVYGIKMGTWVEDGNGWFMIQVNYKTPPVPGNLTTYAGNHANGQGNGISSPFFNLTTFDFTMTKQTKHDPASTIENKLFAQS